jgi:hypothetical protein
MPSIFDSLGYNYTPSANEVSDFSPEVIKSLDSLPPLLEKWQYEDLQNNDIATTNYLVNPVKSITESVRSKCLSIISACANPNDSGNSVSNLLSVNSAASFVQSNSGPNFIAHTDRISGLVQPNENTSELPHYDIAIGMAKTVMMIVYQADGIQNNAPMIGTFTSLFIEQEIQDKLELINNYPEIIETSIEEVTEIVGENTFTYYTSTLTTQEIQDIANDITSITTLFTTRRTHDENFYANTTILLEKFEEMKRYKDLGETENNLINNYIGTDRLKANT